VRIAHLDQAGETYLEHMAFALRVGSACADAAFAAGVHAVLPWLFPTRASTRIGEIGRMIEDRRLRRDGAARRP
jgi:Family of unknown function (DUF6356)